MHLAALLIPQIKANPPHGAAVNVIGDDERARGREAPRLSGVSYASSAAVYGPEMPRDRVPVARRRLRCLQTGE